MPKQPPQQPLWPEGQRPGGQWPGQPPQQPPYQQPPYGTPPPYGQPPPYAAPPYQQPPMPQQQYYAPFPPQAPPPRKKGLPAIAIIGIVIGGLFVLFIIFGVIAAATSGSSKNATATPERVTAANIAPTVVRRPTATNAIPFPPTVSLATITNPTAVPAAITTPTPLAPASLSQRSSIATPTTIIPPTLTPPAKAAAAPSGPVHAKVGQRAEMSGVAITVYQVLDPAVSTNQFEKPKDGFRYVSVDFSIENTSTKAESYNALYATIKDTEARQYDDAFTTVGQPSLSAGNNSPGDKVRGWVTYEIPVNAKLATFKYEPPFSNQQILFDLGG